MAERTVLAAVDDPGRIRAFRRLVRGRPYAVVTLATDVARTTLAAGERPFDLLLVALDPPAYDGLEVINGFRSALGNDRPVLALGSDSVPPAVARELAELGVRPAIAADPPAAELVLRVDRELCTGEAHARAMLRLPVDLNVSMT